MKKMIGSLSIALVCLASTSFAADKKDERAGKCTDAKSQMDYFCSKDNAGGDTLVSLGTACNNAKKNVAAACEGKIEADQTYQFDDKKKK
ncbi:MAG: hypothetical protein ABIP64_13520 [Burkholderiales bacterium]